MSQNRNLILYYSKNGDTLISFNGMGILLAKHSKTNIFKKI